MIAGRIIFMTESRITAMYLTKTLTREHLTRCRLCFGLVLCGISTFVSAQQWKFEPVVLVGAEYNDNIRLIRDDLLGAERACSDLFAVEQTIVVCVWIEGVETCADFELVA